MLRPGNSSGPKNEPSTEAVLDRGYHSNDVVGTLDELGIRTYIAEPHRPRRRWRGQTDVCDAVYKSRRRLGREKGKRLQKRRGELVERSFAHCLETGAMRRATCEITTTSPSATSCTSQPSTSR